MENEFTSVSTDSFRNEAGSNFPLQYIQVYGVDLAYSDPKSGTGLPVIICLHAIGHGGRDFESFRSHFLAKYRVITLDWPGQGNSGPGPEPASIKKYTELFTDFVQKLELKQFMILGNSIGGGVAIKYASENPGRIKALILSNPAGLDKGGLTAKLFTWWIEKKMRSGVLGEKSFKNWFSNYYHQLLVTEAASVQRERIVRSAYEIAPVLEQAWRSFRHSDNDLRGFTSGIQAPVLFAWAKKDKSVRWSRCKKAVSKFRNKKVIFFDAGHAPFLETPVEFNKHAATFFESINF